MIKPPTKILLTAICFAPILFTAFIPKSTKQQSSLRKQLIGEWRNIYVKIAMPPSKTGNVSVVVEADSANWEKSLKIKPIRTHFLADGSYYSEYINLKDSITKRPTGTWALKADTLIMMQLTPDKSETRLHVSISNNVATFSGLIDFFGSGKKQDSYYGKQRKFK